MRSNESTPVLFNHDDSRKQHRSTSGMPMPENGGMLKRSIRFEY
jgi:hypothetical protein